MTEQIEQVTPAEQMERPDIRSLERYCEICGCLHDKPFSFCFGEMKEKKPVEFIQSEDEVDEKDAEEKSERKQKLIQDHYEDYEPAAKKMKMWSQTTLLNNSDSENLTELLTDVQKYIKTQHLEPFSFNTTINSILAKAQVDNELNEMIKRLNEIPTHKDLLQQKDILESDIKTAEMQLQRLKDCSLLFESRINRTVGKVALSVLTLQEDIMQALSKYF